MNPVRLRAYAELLAVSAIWGIAGVVIKYTLSGFSAPIFLTYRFLISSVVALPFFLFGLSKLPKNPKTLALTILNGFLTSTAALLLLFWGAERTTSIEVNLLSAVAPITIAVAGILFLKEKVTKRESLGILIALTGTLIAVIEPTLDLSNGFINLTGNILILGSILVGTASAILSKVVLRESVDPLSATNISFIVGFVTILPFVIPFHSPTSMVASALQIPLKYHLGVIYMAVISGTLGYYLWFKAIKSIEASEAGLFAYLYPVFGIPLSILWLKEQITLPIIIGSAVIAVGVFLAEWKKKRYNS